MDGDDSAQHMITTLIVGVVCWMVMIVLEGLRECRRPSDLSDCYFILPPRWSKIQEKTDILEVNQNVPQ